MADRISNRRGIANSFFLTLHTVLIASAGERLDTLLAAQRRCARRGGSAFFY